MKKLLAVCCSLLAVRCSLLAVRCLLLAVSCPLLAVSCSLFALCAHASALVPLQTTTELTATTPARFRAYHGETVRLTHRLTLAGAPLDLSGASARFYWRTEEMEDWWSTDATLEADSVWCDFTPAMDPGTEAIWYFFGITQANAIAYRANGSLTLLDSPGFTPADLGEPDALAAALEALFKEADTRYATTEELTANSQQLTAHSQQLTANSQQLTANSQQLTAHSQQLTANSQQLTALEAALEGKAEADHAHADLVKQSDVQQVLNESELPVSAKAVYQNVGNVVRNPDIADVVRYVDAGSMQEIGDNHGKVIFAADDGGQGGIIVGGSRTSQPIWTQWTAKLNWDKIRAYNEPGLYEDYSFKPGEGNQIARIKDLPATITVDSTLSSTSKNPVQNKVLYSALNNKADKTALDKKADKNHYHSQYVSAESSAIAADLGEGFELDAARALIGSYDAILGVTEINGVGYIAWRGIYDGLVHRFALGGGGNTEVWKGNVGFGEQDTFFGPKKVAEGEGQFYKGYPRLHNHGQDIHEVSGFSRDSRDDETVWSHRLLLPWDLAKANDTSYLMAGVVWDGQRNLFTDGDTATFVQPLLPQNSGSTQSALPYAIPCFENSPVYWKGTIIWNDGTQAISKAVQIPWARVKQDMRGPTELALKSDIPSIDTALSTTSTNPVQNKAVKAALDKKISGASTPDGQTLKLEGLKSSDGTSYDFSLKRDFYANTVLFGCEMSGAMAMFEETLPTTEITDALASRVTALESGGGSSPTPTLEVATWSGSVCSVPWGANPLLIDCSGQTEYDFTIQFPVADWPEGASRLLFIRATPTPTVGDGIIDSLKGGNGLLTPSVVGYDYLEQGEEYTVSAWRRGSRLRLMVVDRERLSDL